MVQEYVSPVRVHKYPFEMVMAAYERRFPNCPQIPVVIDCAITNDTWSADDSQRHTNRRCQLNVDAPYLLKKMIGVDYIYFIQKNHLDLKSRVLEIEATNETFASRVSVVEKCRYFVHPDNPEWTSFEQSALLDVKNFFGLENTVEKIAMKQYAANIAKGKELIEVFMQEVFDEGTKELRPWSASDPQQNRELRRIVSRDTEPLSPRPLAEAKRNSLPGTSQNGNSNSSGTSQNGNWNSSGTSQHGNWNSLALKKSSQKLLQNRSKSAMSIKDQKTYSNRSPERNKTNLVSSLNLFRSRHNLDKQPSSPKLPPKSDQHKNENQKEEKRRKRLTVSNPDLSGTDEYSLDSEYTKRYLGELSPMQESRLLQLKKCIADLQKGKVPSDSTLLRFLRAREFSVEKAREMLSQSLLWRKKHQVDRILSEYETPDVVKQYFPGGWHHHDKDGRPLYILRLGQMDVKGLLKSIGEDGLLKLTLHVCEEGLKLVEEAHRSWCLLVDLDGLNMRHLWRPGVRALLRIIRVVEDNYPETMGRVLIVRAPRVFPILWTIVSTFIDENTRSKFLFYGGKDYLQPGGLLDYISRDLIPDFLGGPCKSFVHEGGLVPKSLYVSGAFTERDGDPLSEDSIYKSVSLAKGQLHEVVVHNRDPHSVLTWDFDVLRHDVQFTVFRTDQELVPTDPATVSSGEETRSVLEGSRHERAEPALPCHHGESIQGSHVMSSCGSYVLQWRCGGSRDGAQLMYFHETLASHHYRGSMSSLQSATSGFSCLSGNSSCPSR